MSKAVNNLQDIFLNGARKNRIEVIIYLTNGYQIKGFVRGFDSFTIILDCNGKQMLVYKHAVSTITPNRPILFNNFQEE
ncbi:RNA chaperone Hfq [Clostridium sp. MSJ-11]|uniref:RNA-binding protein Hfq n=1 Tax=Clostridium mobile TaxID=2841512 RepID=A0ABS6EEB1_9CLOT|nr:RNA chaperone Hfq [Clostridium mobile]MBU5482815.1 RNA chaperone Hfq [Clostridium mobile]